MGTVITNLKARFGVETTDFKKGLKDGEKAVGEFKDAANDQLSEFVSMFGVNMSGVNSALSTANKSLNFLVQSFRGAATGAEIFSVSMKVVKVALISTGIGAVVVGLGSLIAYFTKSGEGADKFAKILAQLRSVFNNVIDRIMQLGEGLFDIFSGKFQQGWEKMKASFKGIGDEIREDWKVAGQLADAEDALEDREISLIRTLEERRAKAAELRLQAKETTDDERAKIALLREAEAVYRSVYGDQISLESERLRIMKERLAIQSSDPTDEQRKEIAEQEAKISSLMREQAETLKGLTREKNAALKIVNAEVALEQAKTAQVKATNAEINNLKIPDFGAAISNALAPLPKIQQVITDVATDLSDVLNGAFDSIAVGIGEFLGALTSGDAGIKNFGKLIAGTFADLAINVGKIAIGAGLAVLGVKKALMTLNPYVAIAAGVALIAIGSAVRGSLASAASGGGGSSSIGSSSGSSGNFTFDNRSSSPIKIQLTGKLVGQGKDLVAVIDQENSFVNAAS